MADEQPSSTATSASVSQFPGLRRNGADFLVSLVLSVPLLQAANFISSGKQWHAPKKAFRPAAGLTSYAQRSKERLARVTMKAKEKELKDEKEAQRQVRALSTPKLDIRLLRVRVRSTDPGRRA